MGELPGGGDGAGESFVPGGFGEVEKVAAGLVGDAEVV